MSTSKHSRRAHLLPVALWVAGLIALSVSSVEAADNKRDKPVYKWTDEKGVVHYGDSIPPQYSKQDRRVLNEQGVEVGLLEAEKSEAQRAAEAARGSAAARTRKRDQVLLTSYVSEQQIEQLRDQRLDMIEGQVQVTSQYIDTLKARLEALHAQAQFFRPYSTHNGAKPMPDHLAQDLVRTVNEIRAQNRNLVAKREEQNVLRDQFKADIDRYRELKAGRRN
jgi:hypothetical protein